MSMQNPGGPSRGTLVAFLILYLLSVGTSVTFLFHYIGSHTQPSAISSHPQPSTRVSMGPTPTLMNHQAVVYFYNYIENDKRDINEGFLMLHDVSTNRNIEVLRVENINIYSAQVSPDGQWVLFIVGYWKVRESYKLQRIRINGQQRETLYTFPPYFYGSREFRPSLNANWSLDQKSVLIAIDKLGGMSSIGVLDMTTRKMRLVLQIASVQYGYYAVKWLDRTHVYIVASGRYGQEKAPPTELYLLDVTAPQVRRARDLKLIIPGAEGAYLAFDSSPDGKRLFVAQKTQDAMTIWVEPATGGKREILSHIVNTPFRVDTLHVFTNYLLLTTSTSGSETEVWYMPLDGSRHITLFKSTDLTKYFLNRMTQYGWSDISRDGTMFAMGTFNFDTSSWTLFVSPIREGKATVFWDTDAFIVGWTTI
jgi:hypothetical protein